ncbi:MAG: HD domain-containing protein [Chloroflexota bacterium]|nr:HD domain-containing protein [Chloroflexota bacterium]
MPDPGVASGSQPPIAIPERARPILERLWSSGHAAYLVGGAVRDQLLRRPVVSGPRGPREHARPEGGTPQEPADIATDATPEQVLALFPGGVSDNPFGMVRLPDAEVTTFRRDHRYEDRRRPTAVTFTTDLLEDLARRDFTVNAIAFGRPASRPGESRELELVDPTGGVSDLRDRLIRAVGDPDQRFDEDALRLLRAARLAATLGFTIEPVTRAAMSRRADLVRHVSRERVGQEIRKMLKAERPSSGFRILSETGLLRPVLPELVAQAGIPQNKIAGQDLWDHTLLTLDAAAALAPADPGRREEVLLAALLHDVGKPETLKDQRFVGHDEVGAEFAAGILRRLAIGRPDANRVVRLVRWHMFGYEQAWSGAAVRRFIRKVGPDLLPSLFLLREADNVGSGRPPEWGGLTELRRRVEDEVSRRVPLQLSDLAINGDDLQSELGLEPGPEIGALLERLLESVVSEPERNNRARLLADARAWHAAGTTARRRRSERQPGRPQAAGRRAAS